MNHKMETALCYLASCNPSSWLKQLLWIEYVHNTLPSSVTGLSPFQCSWGYQWLLFSEQEREASVALGCRPAPSLCTPPTVTNNPPTDITSLHPVTPRSSTSGYLHGTLPSEWSPRSWLPGLWAHSPSQGSSTLQLSVFVYHGPWGSIPSSMSLRSNLLMRAHFIHEVNVLGIFFEWHVSLTIKTVKLMGELAKKSQDQWYETAMNICGTVMVISS